MPKPPQRYVDAFAKLLAPRPRVLVFVNMPGLAYCAVEVPRTYQVIVGVSIELYRALFAERFEETGKQLQDHVTVNYVQDRYRHIIPMLTDTPGIVPEGGPFPYTPYVQDLVIEPKPIGE